jgi:hypothetical protein
VDLAGLCAHCKHVRRIKSARGSIFYLCQLSAVNADFPKYPHLPVLQCPGYEPNREDMAEVPASAR